MITLRSYEYLEDAWQDGVAAWCEAAASHVLGGGRAWLLTVSDGQANWIKRRLLQQGVSLFGVQFLKIASLRRELCARLELAAEPLGNHALAFTLQLRALAQVAAHPEITDITRCPGVCLSALDDFAAAGWLEDDPGLRREILPAVLDDWLAEVRTQGLWTPENDRRLFDAAGEHSPGRPPLALCVFGWDATFWPATRLLRAAVRDTQSSLIYSPLPRGSSENIQQDWLTSLEKSLDAGYESCASVGFNPSHAALIGRLEGADLSHGATGGAEPELIVGLDTEDAVILARDFVARWLAADGERRSAADWSGDERLVILTPRRDVSAIALLRSLASAGIHVEDELGEVPEPSLPLQIQRAILAYHQESADIDTLTTLVELVNAHATAWHGEGIPLLEEFPLDPQEVRRLLRSAFGEVQHHSGRVLRTVFPHLRSEAARPLLALTEHLSEWPETLTWVGALERWRHCLEGLGLSTESLEPLWSRLQRLSIHDLVPAGMFFEFLAGVLGNTPARRSPDGGHRYARVVLTSLEGAMGQSWGAALFLDSNEGKWPLYPGENPFLDDNLRVRLNQRRAAYRQTPGAPAREYLLTSLDRAQLEHFSFMEILANCRGPVAFAGLARDPLDAGQEVYANEWALRCLLEAGRPLSGGEKLLDRWRGAIRRTKSAPLPLPKAEREHLRRVFADRRDGSRPFDEYSFNFEALDAADELPWTNPWPARDLAAAWNQPATFALRHLFNVVPKPLPGAEFTRGEGWMVGRLVHRWARSALGATSAPRYMLAADWRQAQTVRLAATRRGTEEAIRNTLATQKQFRSGDAALPLWWRGILQKAEWAASRCLQALADVALGLPGENSGVWLRQDRCFQATLGTPAGPLRLQAHCDVVLSSHADLAGASCQMIDFRTGAAPLPNGYSGDRLEKGHGLNLAALLLLALKEGACPEDTQIGVIHPDAVNAAVWTATSQEEAGPAMEMLASQQRSLNFGQTGTFASAEGAGYDGEILPLATVAIDPTVLADKRARSVGV